MYWRCYSQRNRKIHLGIRIVHTKNVLKEILNYVNNIDDTCPPIEVALPHSWSSNPMRVHRTWGSLLPCRSDCGRLRTPGTPILMASMIPSLIRWGLLDEPESGLSAGTAVRRRGDPEKFILFHCEFTVSLSPCSYTWSTYPLLPPPVWIFV